MNTNENSSNSNLESILSIRATSGGERGKEDSGKKYDYNMPKAMFMALVSAVFDKEVEASKPENAKSGGLVAQFCHSFGATADKQEKSGIDPFPEMRYAVVHRRSVDGIELFAGSLAACESWILEHKTTEPEAIIAPAKEKNAFGENNAELWMEVMEFRAPRNGGTRKSAKEIKMDSILVTLALNIPGVTWETLKPGYPDITEADLEAYKAKVNAKARE